MSLNYYEVLEIPTDADAREIKRAYHRMARELHPDKAASPDEARVAEERFALVSAAYNILKDPQKRTDYDKGFARGNGANGSGTNGGASSGKAPAVNRILNAGRAPSQTSTPPGAAAPSAGGSSKPNPGITSERIAIAQKAFARGMQHFKEDNLPKAITFFEAAIQNNDQEAIYHSRLAMSLIREKRSATRAIEAAQRAIDLDPYNMEHKFNLAGIYETIGSKSNAKRIYEEILRWEQDNQRAKFALQGMVKKRAPFGIGGGGDTEAPSPAKSGGGENFLQKIMSHFKR